MRVVSVVLAAGESRRMGQLKALLPFGTGTVIEQAIRPLLQVEGAEVTVVLGHRAADIATVLATWPVHMVYNPNYRDGMTTSVQTALRYVVPIPDAYVLALVDQPHLGLAPVRRVLTAFARTDKGLVIPTYHGKRGHPIVIAARYRQEVLALAPQQGLNVVTRGHADDTLEVSMADDDILRDMDYQAEYEAELRRWQQRSGAEPGQSC